MITVEQLLRKVVLFEQEEESGKLEATGHLPHIVEAAIHGRHDVALRHLQNAVDVVRGKDSEGSLSQKADGKVSILFGKNEGVPFVQYKGKGAQVFNTPEQIEHFVATTGKDYLRDSFLMGLHAASHHRVGDNISYQADTMIDHNPASVKGNIVKYKKPSYSTKSILAVHSALDSRTGKKIEAAPDVSHLESESVHFPRLSMKGRKYKSVDDLMIRARQRMYNAENLLNRDDVKQVTKEIAEHVGPTKTSHRHLLLREFNNKYQNGKVKKRQFGDFMGFVRSKMDATTNKNEKARLQEHLNYFNDRSRRDAFAAMFEGHSHLDSARDHIIRALNTSNPELKPVTDNLGTIDYNQNEGYVSEINDPSIPEHLRMMKFVPREFSIRNSAESAARRGEQTPIQEEGEAGGNMMTASSGGISGMGYNIGGPAPDDVAVPPLASRKAKKFRNNILRKLASYLNVGREAY